MTAADAALKLGQEITRLSNAGALGRSLTYAAGYGLCQALLKAASLPLSEGADEAVSLGRALSQVDWRQAAVVAYRLGVEVRMAREAAERAERERLYAQVASEGQVQGGQVAA